MLKVLAHELCQPIAQDTLVAHGRILVAVDDGGKNVPTQVGRFFERLANVDIYRAG
jgi:hypothetical protein